MLLKIMLVLSVLLGTSGMIFLQFYAEAQEACERISDQCADAGFAWEASGKLMLLTAIFTIITGLMSLFVHHLKERMSETERKRG